MTLLAAVKVIPSPAALLINKYKITKNNKNQIK